jgi:LDH2 family malate/lactate/ureidoglycolate dehydrogenase
MDSLSAAIKGRRKLPGVDEILLPGEPEHRAALANRRLGVPLDEKTVQELEDLCRESGIPGLIARSS